MGINLVGLGGRDVTIEPPYELRKPGVSEEEFFRIAGDDHDWELHDGVLVMHSPAAPPHERLFVFLLRLFSGYVEEKELGVVLGSQCPMRLGGGRIYSPDLLFVAASRLEIIGERCIDAGADVVLEILSPSTRDYDLGQKRQAFQDERIREIWFIDPEQRKITLESLHGTVYQTKSVKEGRLSSKVISGLWIDPGWLWQEPLPKLRPILEQLLV